MIETISHFFDLNYPLVQFFHGLVYFVLGLAIALQARYRSRLALAHSLGWLAIFGILQGMYEWGQLFIPIQAEYMNHASVGLLQLFGALVLGSGYAALLQFGVSLSGRNRQLFYRIALVLMVGWLLLIAGLGLRSTYGIGLWELYATLTARYLLGIPAALLTAYGLREQAARQIRPFGLTRVYTMLQMTGIAFVFLALFSGLLGPYAPFFPANRINQSLLTATIGVPVELFRSLFGAVILVGILQVLSVFEVEVDRELQRMQMEQSIMAERERIGRELHDGAIQMVYTAGLLVESIRSKVKDSSAVVERIDRAAQVIDEAIAGLRAYMTDLREPVAAQSLVDGLRALAYDSRFTALLTVDLALDIPDTIVLNPIQTAHLLAITSEALSNCVRHAQADRVQVRAEVANGCIELAVTDNGVGFEPALAGSGFGLRNMRDRARMLNGDLLIEPLTDGGTQVRLRMPLE